VAEAIRTLSIRGAPAIGLAAAYALALAAESLVAEPKDRFLRDLETAASELQSTRPTAVNLFWALERMRGVVRQFDDEAPPVIADRLLAEAESMIAEDEESNRLMADFGAELIPAEAQILTHCNTGALATGAIGTALGVILRAHEQGKRVHVWVDETRPLLQGARLTTWELQQAGVPYTLITDNMAAHFMGRGQVDLAIVGADRIAANGDTANKIGTYGVAVLCGVRVAPEGAPVANPAFDVTPSRLIAGIVTDKGVIRAPFEEGLTRAVRGETPASATL
jgi:methylthioribose-1-phosphate isomerase